MPEYLTKVQIAASFRKVSEELAKVSYNRFACGIWRSNGTTQGRSAAPVISGCNYQLFAFASQFRTTDIGAVSACLTFVLMRNSCPSRRTSYTNTSLSDTCSRGLAW
jgi:hypothetical protein